MAIVHDAYLFSPETFFGIVYPYVEALTKTEAGYRDLRDKALQVYEQDAMVRSLCEEYGGWSRSAIETQFPLDKPDSPQDIAFWLVILLFSNFGEGTSIGLGHDFRLLDNILERHNWRKDHRDLLLWGHDFKDLPILIRDGVRASDRGQQKMADIWEHIRPSSASGWAGWLSKDDVLQLYSDLQALKEKSLKDTYQITGIHRDSVETLVGLADQMLTAARSKGAGLCLIVSG